VQSLWPPRRSTLVATEESPLVQPHAMGDARDINAGNNGGLRGGRCQGARWGREICEKILAVFARGNKTKSEFERPSAGGGVSRGRRAGRYDANGN